MKVEGERSVVPDVHFQPKVEHRAEGELDGGNAYGAEGGFKRQGAFREAFGYGGKYEEADAAGEHHAPMRMTAPHKLKERVADGTDGKYE